MRIEFRKFLLIKGIAIRLRDTLQGRTINPTFQVRYVYDRGNYWIRCSKAWKQKCPVSTVGIELVEFCDIERHSLFHEGFVQLKIDVPKEYDSFPFNIASVDTMAEYVNSNFKCSYANENTLNETDYKNLLIRTLNDPTTLNIDQNVSSGYGVASGVSPSSGDGEEPDVSPSSGDGEEPDVSPPIDTLDNYEIYDETVLTSDDVNDTVMAPTVRYIKSRFFLNKDDADEENTNDRKINAIPDGYNAKVNVISMYRYKIFEEINNSSISTNKKKSNSSISINEEMSNSSISTNIEIKNTSKSKNEENVTISIFEGSTYNINIKYY